MAPPVTKSYSRCHSSKRLDEFDRIQGKRELSSHSNSSSPGAPRREPQRAASFHGRTTTSVERASIGRPKTQPELLGSLRIGGNEEGVKFGQVGRVPNKVLVNVSVKGCLLGPLQVLASTEWTVGQLVEAAICLYVKERRRPPLASVEARDYGLHYSQFSLQALDPDEKLIGLGSRNFFLCPKANNPTESNAASSSSSSSTCSDQAEKLASKIGVPWLRFIEYFLM